MPDRQPESPPQESPPPTDLSTEIGATLASVWARYVGARPTGATVELQGSAVRWILPDGNGELESGLNRDGEDGEAPPAHPARTLAGYMQETSAAVAKATRRRVRARISKQDAKTGVATETFILERLRERN